jgi:hypothetical protein
MVMAGTTRAVLEAGTAAKMVVRLRENCWCLPSVCRDVAENRDALIAEIAILSKHSVLSNCA